MLLALAFTLKVVKATTVTELKGISTAAMSGESVPCTANESPIML